MRRAVPDNRVTSEPIAVLFVLQEEKEEEERERRRGEERRGGRRENIQPPTDVGELMKVIMITTIQF